MKRVPHPELEEYRAQFPILARKTYLNSCSLGALSTRSSSYLTEFQELWHEHGASAWYELWLGRMDDLRKQIAKLLNARDPEIALVPSVSAALSSISSAIDHSQRSRIVMGELDFPTVAHQWLSKPQVELIRVPSADEVSIELDSWKAAVDERTAAVVTSHVFFTSGQIQDVRAISRLAHDAGALSIVDGYQATGQIPVDPRALGADVYVTGPLKWMLGGPGIAFLWVREERIEELRPTIASWFGVENQFGFDGGALELRGDAGRFTMGTPSMPSVYTALGGAEIIAEVGVERIRARVASLTEDLIERLRESGFQLRIPELRADRSGIVMIRAGDAAGAVRRLSKAGVIVDSRGEFVRVSPHFYNTVEENERLVNELRRSVSSR